MQQPLISVIVPIYKVENYLDKCVESILAQTYKNLEVWLVDDGSPDRCGEMCDEWAKKDSRINVIHKQNGGLSDARNVAIDVANGEWIVFVDSDDFVSGDYIETLHNLATKYDCKMSVAQNIEFNENEDVISPKNEYIELCQKPLDAIQDMFYQKYYDTAAWAKMYHRSLFESGIRYPKGLLHEDLPTTYLLMSLSDKVAYCNKVIYYYLLRKDSIEGAAFSNKKLDCLWIIDKLMSEHKDLLDKVWLGYICKRTSFSFHIFLQMPTDHEEYNKVFKYVTEHRLKILLDSNARMKTRCACLISYFGKSIVRLIFKLINKR